MKTPYKLITGLLMSLTTSTAFAQEVEMADTFRSEGKIYVVVAIVLIVLAGFIAYLFRIDRKLTNLERRISNKAQTK